ncbi:phage tail protein [Pseudorhodoferax sp. Leaf274]|uniref:phage tail protein n=1 Tax=Pseudorhodoferax sp. Leaf274 TaxID=1736318 RepID=UPI000703781D|nr:phage tail protein [Pseudorhodoferax sp. Leaf274]KQP37380.1 phage tail protein [Pseudorhodoferax sp. Leaf274]
MDANGQRFWLLGESAHFPFHAHTAWDADCRRLRLASERTLTLALAPAAAFTAAQEALERIPRAIDALECVARWDADSGTVRVRSVLPDEAVLMALDATPTDLCGGADGVLYAVLPGAVLLHDLRGRWGDVRVALAGFTPWRAAPAADGGIWLLERGTGRLARLTGRPRRTETPQPDDYDPRVFRPSPENACAPQIRLLAGPPGDGSENAVALASGPDGALALLSWATDGAPRLRRWRADAQRWEAPFAPQGAAYAHALAWLAPDRVALRVPGRRDAPAWALGATPGPRDPLGDVYPLAPDANEAPFCNGPVQPPCYPVGSAGAEPLHALSLNRFAAQGEARHYADSATGLVARLIDSGDTTTVWHRLFAEAVLPARTGFVAWLAATDEPAPPAADDGLAWHAHGFGHHQLGAPQLPQAVWEPVPSELPHHPGLLGGAQEPGQSGLFSVLVQNSRQRVRSLAGRYLWLRVALQGDGHATPEIAALRVWGSRFSYVDQYLPRLYRESLFGSAASQPGERLAAIDTDFGPALDAADASDAALRARLLLEQVTLGAAAHIAVERAGQAWLLQDGASAWRLRHEGDAIAIYRPRATPADFQARLLASFEGVLTRLEDRVASAHLLSDPALADDSRLDWLASWIGVAFDPALPAARRRDWLRAASDLARWHGTRRGLQLALDIATGGAVRGGEVLVVEDFRLRRILATLLGVDLADERDPLLPGLQVSGNSVVGDTLFVGEQARAELAALFDAGQLGAAGEQAALAFDAQLAHRATVLVHQAVEPQDLGLIRRIAELEAPAHVELRVAQASWPLLVGIASLVGVDTYLGPPRLPRPVQVQRSGLGLGDYLVSAAVLDPRLAGAPAATAAAPPEADAGADRRAPPGASFVLDGSGSRAASGRAIAQYRWRWLPPSDP